MTSQSTEYLQSEQPAIRLFQKIGYDYLDAAVNDERDSINDVVLIHRLKAAIRRINPWLNENNVNNAVRKITSVPSASLMEANETIHELISGREFTPKQVIKGREHYHGVGYVDFQDIDNNDFLVVNQIKFKGRENNSIPDIVVFVNGLPLGVIECKSPKIRGAKDEAISDLLYYQENSEKLFRYNQVCAGVYKVGGRYGALGAKQEHYQVYRDETGACAELTGEAPTAQDILIYNLFEKNRFLDIIRNFVIFETSEGTKVKKLPRYQQIRATNKAIEKLKKDSRGGVIWHTQGSGKSITMVYIATKLKREESGFDNPTIIIITDRTDLDDQIFRTFHGCGFSNPIHADSVRHLKTLLRDDYGKTITTTIQKFQETDSQGNIIRTRGDEIETISKKENLYVLVDEAHRTQYGFLAGFMRKALKNARFIAFTGTPIDNDQKSTLGRFYGGKYLDVYTIKQSVEDGEELIEERKQGRLTQLELFGEFEKIRLKIIHKSKEARDLGFATEREFAVYKTLDSKLEGGAREATAAFFESIGNELSIDGWENKTQVKKSIRVKIKDMIRGRTPADEVEPVTASLLDILKRN